MINIHQRSDGGMGTPPGNTNPHHRGNIGDYPSSIQSFILSQREERSNNAQRGPTNCHTFGDLKEEKRLSPTGFLLLEPRKSTTRSVQPASRDDDGRVCMRGAGCTRGA